MERILGKVKGGRWDEWLGWPIWLVTCFLATILIGGLIAGVGELLGYGTFIDSTLGSMVLSALVYVILTGLLISIARMRYVIQLPSMRYKVSIVLGAIILVFALSALHLLNVGLLIIIVMVIGAILTLMLIPRMSRAVTRAGLGVARQMCWGDIGLGMAGYVIYFLIFIAVTLTLSKLIPAYNADQAQDLGFNVLFGIERTIGFIVLVVVAPLAEELVMRGFLFGKLRESKMPFWPAALIVSVAFGIAHGQWNVGVDTFILSMVACYLREMTGTIWPGVIIHMLKNAVAYILLFVFVIR